MKKLFALVLALVMVMSLATTTFATETNLTIRDNSGYTGTRTYNGYQLMTVTEGEGDAFAYTVNAKYKTVLIETLGLESTATDSDIVEAVQLKNTAELIRVFANDIYRAILAENLVADKAAFTGTVTVAQGYWLIADVTNLDGDGDGEYDEGEEYSNSLVMLDTAGDSNITINNKPDVPTTFKKVDDEEDSVVDPVNGNEDATEWEDSADYDIGDLVPFEIAGTLANNVATYDYYMFRINDNASQGLTYDPDTFTIYVNGVKRTIGAQDTTNVDFWYNISSDNELSVYPAHGYYTHELNEATTDDLTDYVWRDASAANGGDFLKLFPENTDRSEINSSTFTFTYKCKLNDNAVTGSDGNPNTSNLTFSNNPYGDSFGETVPDTTITFTYKTIFNKVDGRGQELEGADFDVYKFIAVKNVTEKEKEAAVELVDLLKTEDTVNAANNNTLIHHPGANSYGHLVKLEKKSTNAVADDLATDGVNESKAATEFTFNGMDAGFYRLVETLIPEGYHGVAPIDFHIIADHDEAIIDNDVLNNLSALTRVSGEITIVGDVLTGTLEADIENHTGDELPSTGGIGTTLFYVFGSIMVLGAVVLLVTKKRMAA